MYKKLLLLVSLFAVAIIANAQSDNIEAMLKKIEAVSGVEKLEKADTTRSYYLMKFRQQLVPGDESKGTFEQRVMLGHRGYDRPVVVVTEGYGADYAFNNPRYMEELTSILDANIIFVEYRYFSGSTPQPCNWEYLTVANSMADYHNIITAFKKFYTKKWATTGISKGGSTSMFFRAYYPDDVDVTVPYVGPLSCAVEDGRHESFLERVSTKEKRDAVRNYQYLLFERKEQLMPLFDAYCAEQGYTFRAPSSEIYDLCVLEYQFSFWQWGAPIDNIPTSEASDDEVFAYFVKMCSPDYFSATTKIGSFFVQAVKDFGYYGYNADPFVKYINPADIEGYLKKVMLPAEFADVVFDDTNHRKVTDFYTENDPEAIFIYGEWDPWTASGVTWLSERGKENVNVFIVPDGSHSARIANLPPAQREKVLELLDKWMDFR